MIAGSCDTARERIPELALGRLEGAERAEVLLHVHGCARCQAILDEFSGVADLLARSAPEAEPPPGFDRRVLAAMHGGRARDWRSVRRRVLVIAGAAAAAAILSVAVVRIIDAGRVSDQASAPALLTIPMIGGGGLPVGRVVVSAGSPASVVVTVDYALPNGVYELRLQTTTGTVTRGVGTLTVADGRGTWTGTLPIPRTGTVLAMVDASGMPVCQARLELT
jgi:hypothetical protein